MFLTNGGMFRKVRASGAQKSPGTRQHANVAAESKEEHIAMPGLANLIYC
jgi:hypothetical protein